MNPCEKDEEISNGIDRLGLFISYLEDSDGQSFNPKEFPVNDGGSMTCWWDPQNLESLNKLD